ncbi:pyridoxamine 5'-phosphate oxidase [Subtercola lobariae]|nr:pyridoxamine 5'-phosphate oxidase [Subtercola lobariae]
MNSLITHRDYGSEPLNEADLAADPFEQFASWLADAESAELTEPNAMVLSTVDGDGVPSSRTVLLRGVHEGGFEFYTNYDSRKGRALAEHPVASALFPWYLLQRQVIITGTVERVSSTASDTYFASRPYKSQIAAIASEQSRPIDSRGELESRMAEVAATFPENESVPRPDGWGGFRLVPSRVEFWKGRRSRLHDRLVYSREASGDSAWQVTRLQP